MTEQATGDPPGLDVARFATWFTEVMPGLVTGALSARLIAGGKSNLTYEVTDGVSTWIVRRPPLGHVLATAHDMAREYRVISALRGTAVPVPRTYVYCDDPEVIGAPFYVMEKVNGRPYRDFEELVALGRERTRAISIGLVDTLATLHEVDPAAVGLADFGRPAGGRAVSGASAAPGFLTEEEMLQRYAARSARDFSRFGFYLGLAAFKLATILEGIHYRYLSGQTVGPGFEHIGSAVEPLLDIGLAALKEYC